MPVSELESRQSKLSISLAEAGIESVYIDDPVELAHVARSFDSCLVCTVHAYDAKTGKEMSRFKVGGGC